MPRFLDTETLFRDRVDAGQRLAKRLESYRHASPVVFAIPRGGVPVGAEIARSLDAELDVVVARKLGAPFHAELAIGAVTADGERFLSQDIISQLRVDDAYLEQITKEQGEEARGGSSGFAGAAHRWTSKAEPPCWWTMDSRRGLRCVRLPAPSASASPAGWSWRFRWAPGKRARPSARMPTRWCASPSRIPSTQLGCTTNTSSRSKMRRSYAFSSSPPPPYAETSQFALARPRPGGDPDSGGDEGHK